MRKFGLWVLTLLLTLCVSAEASAQRRVTGRVTGPAGEPVQSASVTVQGTTIGALTLEDGRYILTNVPEGAQVLVARRIGFRRVTQPLAAGSATADIRLERDVLQLETQVVTGTNTSVSSANSANAVSVVSSEALTRVAAPTIDNALQGKIAGAIISQNSGAPGGGTQVQLRGVSTLLGSYSPLYVVDGIIVNNSTIANGANVISGAARGNYSSAQDQSVNRIADLNPNDIESVQVLKGPSASSIYGSKGTNGVILITTKQGRAGKNTIDITQRLGRSSIANTLGSRCFQSGSDFADWRKQILGDATAAGRTAAIAEYDAAPEKCHDYENEFYSNNSLAYETIASLRGGTTAGTTYFVSGLAKHDNGLVATDFYNKQSLRINVGQTVGSRLTLHANSELLHTLTQRGVSGNDNNGISPGDIFSNTPSFYDLQRNADGSFPINPSELLGGSNPFQNADLIKTPENVYRVIGSLSGNLSLYSSSRQTVDASITTGFDSYADNARIVSPSTGYTEQNSFGSQAGTLFNSDANVVNANVNGSLVHRLVMPSFTAQTSGGFRQERRQANVTQITGRGVIFPSVTSIDQAAATYPAETQSLAKDFAVFVQEEFFALSDRLLVTAGVNAERSSNNGDQKKYFSYPKFSASYRIPMLPDYISELKLRGAWGRAGNLPTAGRETFLTPLLYEGTTGARASSVKGNPDIHPERATETEGGFDITALDSRVRFSATAYRKVITDLLLQPTLAPSTGFTSTFINGGQLTNRGTELELDVTPVQTGRFTWVSTNTFSRIRSNVDSLPVPAFNPGVGSFSTSYGNAWIQQGLPITTIQAYNGCSTALSSSGACSTVNKVIDNQAGDANPDFTAGFNNEISFGRVRLSGLLEWRKGGDVVNLTNNYFDGANLAPDTVVSRARYQLYRAGKAVYVEDAGFVKLREITLGYDLPTAVTSNILNGLVQSARLEISGRNLKTWTNYTGYDPEVSNFGNQPLGRFQDVTPYPPSRQFLVSISTTF